MGQVVSELRGNQRSYYLWWEHKIGYIHTNMHTYEHRVSTSYPFSVGSRVKDSNFQANIEILPEQIQNTARREKLSVSMEITYIYAY